MDFSSVATICNEVIDEFHKLKIKDIYCNHTSVVKHLFDNFYFVSNVVYWPEFLKRKAIIHFMQVVFDTSYIPEYTFEYTLKTPQSVNAIDARLAFLILTRNNVKVEKHSDLEHLLREFIHKNQKNSVSLLNSDLLQQKQLKNEILSETQITNTNNILAIEFILSKCVDKFTPQEIVIYAFEFFCINISYSEYIHEEFKLLIKHNKIPALTDQLIYEPFCSVFKKQYSMNSNFFLKSTYQENLRYLYTNSELQVISEFEGYTTLTEFENEYSVQNTFIYGFNPINHNEINFVTQEINSVSDTLRKNIPHENILTYKMFSCSVSDWITNFINNSSFVDFGGEPIGVNAINKLENISRLYKQKDMLDTIKYIKVINEHNKLILTNFSKTELEENLNTLFKFAMILRGKVDFTNEIYPIDSIDTVNSNQDQIETLLSEIVFDSKFLEIPIFNKNNTVICNLQELLEKINKPGSIDSCIRINSNYLLYTYINICRQHSIKSKIDMFDFIL